MLLTPPPYFAVTKGGNLCISLSGCDTITKQQFAELRDETTGHILSLVIMTIRFCCLLPLWLMVLFCVSCKKEAPKNFTKVTFVIPATLTPERTTFAVGDTLWLTVNCSDSLLDVRSNRRFRVQPQDLSILTAVGFYQLLGQSQEKARASAAFQVVNQVGKLPIVGNTFGRLEPVYDGHFYRAKIGIIPRQRGVFALLLFTSMSEIIKVGGLLPFIDPGLDAEGNAQTPIFDAIYYVLNEGRTNFPLLQQHSRTVSTAPGAPEPEVYAEQKGTFAFTVN